MNVTIEQQNLANTLAEAIDMALKAGATAVEGSIATNQGISVDVREGKVDTLEYIKDKSLSLRVYNGYKKGSVSSSDFSSKAIQASVKAALSIANYTQEDEFAGLADKNNLCKAVPDLDLNHPRPIIAEDAIQLARATEAAGLAVDASLSSEGANYSQSQQSYYYGNSHGFLEGYQSTDYSLSCSLIAHYQDAMQRDYDYSTKRNFGELMSPESIGKNTAARAIARKQARQIKTQSAPVLFAARISPSLFKPLIQAINGHSIVRDSSFLKGKVGGQILPTWMDIVDTPHVLKGLGSAPFDAEGVQTRDLAIVQQGRLSTYLLDSYTARKLKLNTTGHASGIHNLLFLANVRLDFEQMLSKMGSGLIVTEMMGQGVNIVNGDYSRGASGFWVENGQIQYPVEEITIAGNLADMYQNIAAIGSDIDTNNRILAGSVLLESMTIAGH